MRDGPIQDGKRTAGGEFRHRRRRWGAKFGALFHFRRQEAVMGGLLLVMATCIVGGTMLGRSVCRLLHIRGTT